MTDTTIRWSLWLACPFNLAAAAVLAIPSSTAGQLLGLPDHVSPLYSSLVSLFVGLFGFTYAWLAMQPGIDRPLLTIGAIGKFVACGVVMSLWAQAAVPDVLALVGLGDLGFAALWFSWLFLSRG